MNPSPFHWRTGGYPAAAMLSGLLSAQIIAGFQVYFSNKSLYRSLTEIGGAGYLTVPNPQTMGRLLELTTAFSGGLFFTLTVGAGISLLSFSAAWAWDRVCLRKTIFLLFLIFLWAISAAAVNWKEFSPFTWLYPAVIPPVVFGLTLRWMPPRNRKQPWRNGLLHTIPILVLGILWAFQMEKGLFFNIRDYLLLNNSFGERVVSFYYRYTLYPAEVMKSLEQKLQKTYRLEAGMTYPEKNELRKVLIRYDWFDTDKVEDTDLFLKASDGWLLLDDGKNTLLKISKDEFFQNPEATLKRFSDLADGHRVFRRLTFYSLLIGFPVTLYIFVYSFFYFFIGRWVPSAAFVTAILCFSLALMAFWQTNRQHMAVPKDLDAPLTSHDREEQLRALLKDPSPMVVTSALSALAQRREKKAISEILTCIKTSDHWVRSMVRPQSAQDPGVDPEKRQPRNQKGSPLKKHYSFAMTPAGSIFITRPMIFHGYTGTVEDLTFFSIRSAMMAAPLSTEIKKGLLLSI